MGMRKKTQKQTALEERLEAELEASAQEAEEGAVEESEGNEEEALVQPPDALLEAPEEDMAALRAERDGLKDRLLRARAEFENYRKRMVREAERTQKLAAESLIRDLLPVVDHLELAVQHAGSGSEAFLEGVQMVLDQFHEVLRRNGLEPIPGVGAPFDPNVHEAVMQTPSEEVPAGMVAQEFQKGYLLGPQVLRPAKVVVSGGAAEDSENHAPDTPPPNEEDAPAQDNEDSAN